MNRRSFLGAAAGAVPALALQSPGRGASGETAARFRTAICAYSFREALKAKNMTYEDLVRLAVETGVDGIDMTVYWFPDTSDAFVLPLRRFAYKNRVDIYSLAVRAQMCQPTEELREKELASLRQWVDVAQKMGSTHVRVFGGRVPKDATTEQAVAWAAETMKRGAEYSGARGIILGLEDDGGITDYAAQTVEIVKRVDSPWAGINLDTGNFKAPKVLDQIEMCIPYAVSSHLKTEMRLDDGTRAPQDWDRIYSMFARHGYKGYLALEYEAAADPATAVPPLLKKMRELARKYSSV